MSDEVTERRKTRQRLGAAARRIAAGVEVGLGRARYGVKRRFGWVEPVEVLPYRGFGTADRVYLVGRVIEAKGHEPPAPEDSRYRNFRRMVRRLTSAEIPGARVAFRFGDAAAEARTDDEGYFAFDLRVSRLPPPAADGGWYEGEVELLEAVSPGQGPVRAPAPLLIPAPETPLMIVSDIDDTVLQTHVTDLLKMIRVTMLGNALTRLPFEGTTALFRALVEGPAGTAGHPVFYVSKSPWGLHDLLVDFLDRHGLPRGPLFLRQWGLRAQASLDFKESRIEQLLDTYPAARFVLVGDSGERDPEIYLDITERHPGRVAAIYIREVHTSARRHAALEAVAARARALGAEMQLVAHAADALAHARARGLAAV